MMTLIFDRLLLVCQVQITASDTRVITEATVYITIKYIHIDETKDSDKYFICENFQYWYTDSLLELHTRRD